MGTTSSFDPTNSSTLTNGKHDISMSYSYNYSGGDLVSETVAHSLQETQKYVFIRPPFPIYINYFTTEINENKETIYLTDIYNRDEKMKRAIYK